MGKAIYCDRCNCLMNENNGCMHNFRIVDLWMEDMELDFCEDCRGALDDFVHGDDLKKEKKKKK